MTGNKSIAVLCCFLLSVGADQAYALEYQWNEHQVELGARARIATVETDENARAGSLLVRLRAQSEWHSKLQTLIEVDYVELAWEGEFTNGVNFNDKPVIPDVEGADLNQALMTYSPTNTLDVLLGREAVRIGNQRFIGTNSFWQNEQTLDTVGFNFDFASASHISYRYVDNANRINGEEAGKRLDRDDAIYDANNGARPAKFLGDHDHDTHLIFAKLKEWDFSEIQAYYFDIKIEDAKALSNNTLGMRYEYKGRAAKFRALAFVEMALQERPEISAGDNLEYQNIGVGLGYRASEVSLSFERLGEDKGASFVTPLASLHDENGWADKFLLTPVSGLRDYSIKYIWRHSPLKVDARYHFFHADNDQRTMGRELDIDIEYTLAKHFKALLRFADFSAQDAEFSDEKRIFLMLSHAL